MGLDVNEVQALLDKGMSQSEVSKELNTYRQYVYNMIKKGDVEVYEAFDESGTPEEVMNFEWLWHEDFLDDICKELFENDYYLIPLELDDNWLSLSSYVRGEYNSLINYFEVNDLEPLLEGLYMECKCCGVANIKEFRNKGGRFGLEKVCMSCDKKRLRNYVKTNKEIISSRAREWKKENYERCKANNEKYRLLNPDKYRAIYENRRAIREELPGTFSVSQSKLEWGSNCVLSNDDNIHFDHFIPLSWGHAGSTNENMYPLSGALNSSKWSHNPFEWINHAEKEYGIDRNKFDVLVEKLAELNGLTPEEYRQFVYWCEANKRNVDEIKRDKRPSVEIWKEAN